MSASVGLIIELSLQPVAGVADVKCVGGGFMTYWSSSVVYCALLPIFVVSHELGHAAVNLARSEAPVSVALGRPPGRWRFRIGRADFTVGLNFWHYRKPAGMVSQARLDKWSTVACGLAGPLAQAAVSTLLIPIGVATHHPQVGDAGVVGVCFALSSLVPYRLGGFRSDGANIIDSLRRQEVADVKRRWLALFDDVHGTLGPARGHVINGLPPALGHPGTGADALALFRLAFAGWCWRAVENAPSPEMRRHALDALEASTRTGATEPQLTYGAAASLSGWESIAGLEQLPRELRPAEIDEDKQHFAFRFGMAFYDIERAKGSVE
jgi:hypothetical protein